MKFCISTVEYWNSLGVDVTSWRKSIDGTLALCHMEYAQIFKPNVLLDSNVQIYDYNTQELEQALINGFGNLPITLEQAQNNAIKMINNNYNQILVSGFASLASGTSVQFAYEEEDQKKFMKLMLAMISGGLTYPVSVYSKDGTEIIHTQPQLQQLFSDISAFEWCLQNKLHVLIGQIKSCTTIDEVNALDINF